MIPVVAAAIIREGRVLAARRTSPPEVAGRWEFPGGKVEPGETPDDALVREIAEELGCVISVDRWFPQSSPIGDSHVLSVALALLDSGEPMPTEHDVVRWLDAQEMEEVDWLDSDRPFLAEVSAALLEWLL